MSHPFAHERDDGFGLVDVRVVTGIVQRHEGGVGIVRQQGLLIFVSDDLVLLAGDDEHAAVLRKEVVDVVMMVTGAMEAPTLELFKEFIAHADAQVPLLEPFDEVTQLLRCELGAKLAADALEDMVDDRERVGANLQYALGLLGEMRPVEYLVELWKSEA